MSSLNMYNDIIPHMAGTAFVDKKHRIDKLRLRESLVKMAYESIPLLSLGLINAFVVSAILWPYVSHSLSITWLTLNFLLTIWRLTIFKLFRDDPKRYAIDDWERFFRIGVIISAILWGAPGVLFFVNDSLEVQAFLIIVLVGTASAAVISLISMVNLLYIFILAVMIPLMVQMLIMGTFIHLSLAFMMALFLIVILSLSARFHRSVMNTMEAGYRYDSALDALKSTEEQYRTIVKEAPAGICYYDTQRQIIGCNDKFLEILHISQDQAVTVNLATLPDKALLEAIEAVFENREGFYEGFYRSKIAKLDLWVTLRTAPLHDTDGRIIGGIGIFSDITDRIQAEQTIRHQAFHDGLTDLPNRVLLMDHIDQTMIRYRRYGTIAAILFLDLDRFKTINDSLGHHVGDALLQEIARRILSVTRQEDTVSRLGGDEFVVLVSDLGHEDHLAAAKVEAIAHKIHDVIIKPFEFDGSVTITTSTSIGIALVTPDVITAEELLKQADTAMYEAKREGRGITRFYAVSMDEWIKRRLKIENDLRSALEHEKLTIFFQPIADSEDECIVGAEALLRWQHDELGAISPDEMIPIAEDSGLIIPLGQWIMKKACEQFVLWHRQLDATSKFYKIAINVSVKQFLHQDFVESVDKILQDTSMQGSWLELELTESVIVDNVEEAIRRMQMLRQRGITISIDDFGTGYSSLSYIKRLPFTTLKIDKAFIQDLRADTDNEAVVKTIISMAEIFKLNVIAEGIESREQLQALRKLGRTYCQGYYFGMPVTAQQFAKEFLPKSC